MHLCHRADAVDAISPCGAIFLFVFLSVSPPAFPVLLPPSPAILQCPLSNGIKWSTKCGQDVATMMWRVVEDKSNF